MPSPDELVDFARRGVEAQRAVDAITGASQRRRIPHPELLEPIELPRMHEPQVIISMDDYRAYERFLDVFVTVENAIARGRLEARIEAYEMVLRQVELNDTLSPVRQPGLIDALQRIVASCRADLARLEGEAPTPLQGPSDLGRGASNPDAIIAPASAR